MSELNEFSYAELEELILLGLHTDGGHHKQWVLEQIARLAGIDLMDVDFDPGTPP